MSTLLMKPTNNEASHWLKNFFVSTHVRSNEY